MTQWIVSSSVLILVIIALRFFLRRRVKPLLQYGIWALVLVRLLLPFQLGSTPISIENAVEKAPLVQEMSYAQQVTHFDYHPDGSATGYYTFSPVLDHDSGTHNEPVPELFTHAEADRIANLRTAKQYLTSLWIGGMIAIGAVFLISNGVFALRLKKSRKLLEKGRLSVYETSVVETPCYFGMLRPAIYLPPAVAAEERHRIFAVTHELTHYRHGDELWAALRCLCLVIHWYNPLVWLAAILSREDCEIACDESTIVTLGESHRTEYGRVLIDLTCRRYTDLLRTATTMTGSALGLKDRIKMIVKKPKTAIYALIAVILVAAISVGCTFTGSSGRSANMPTGSQTEPTLSDTHPTASAVPSGATHPTEGENTASSGNEITTPTTGNSTEETTATTLSGTTPTEPSETTATQPSETQPFAPVPLDPNCEHSFMAATCTAPKTCLNCGGTEGTPRAKHVFMEASCTEPSTCFYCDATVGEPLPHTFVDGSCKVCRAHDPVRPFDKITSWIARYVNQGKECEEFGKVLSTFILHPAPTNSTNFYQYTYYDLYSNRSYMQHPNGEGLFYEGTAYYDFYFTGYPEGNMHYTVLDNDHIQVSLYVYTESWTGQELLVQFEMVRASDTTFRVTSSTNTSAIPVDLVFEARGSWAEGKGISVP